MAISPIQPQQIQSTQPGRGNLVEEQRAPKPGEAVGAQAAPTAQSDQVSFQGKVAGTEAGNIVAERVVARVELETSTARGAQASRDLFAAAGKAEFEASATAAAAKAGETPSPEATADRIIDGVTGHIFGAFQQSKPNPSPEDIQNFREQVNRGLEAGLEDARDILTGLQVLTPEVERNIEQTEALVRDRLGTFFEELSRNAGEANAENALALEGSALA